MKPRTVNVDSLELRTGDRLDGGRNGTLTVVSSRFERQGRTKYNRVELRNDAGQTVAVRYPMGVGHQRYV
jgi:hypothetical protein